MKTFRDGAWTPSEPEIGERVVIYDQFGGSVEKSWYPEVKNNKIVVTSHNNRIISSVNTSINVTAEIRDSEDNLIEAFNDTFAMPIQRVNGAIEKTVGMTFVNGVCNKEIVFNSSGEYEVTENLVNMHLSSENKLDFKTINISIYE